MWKEAVVVHFKVLNQALIWREWGKPRKYSVSIVGVLPEIRTCTFRIQVRGFIICASLFGDWYDIIKMYQNKLECKGFNSTHLAQNRDMWRAQVTRESNFRFRKRRRNLDWVNEYYFPKKCRHEVLRHTQKLLSEMRTLNPTRVNDCVWREGMFAK